MGVIVSSSKLRNQHTLGRTCDARAEDSGALLRVELLRQQTDVLPVDHGILSEETKLSKARDCGLAVLAESVVDLAAFALEAAVVDVQEADRVALFEVDFVFRHCGANAVSVASAFVAERECLFTARDLNRDDVAVA